MDLCVAFGEPSPERLVESLTDEELADWMEYVAIRGLPSHMPFQFASFASLYLASKGVKDARPDKFLLVQKPKPKGDLRQRIKQNMSIIGKAIKARGTS